ncbi:hypothetical protein Tco_0250932 [Tanacetum coccineum]
MGDVNYIRTLRNYSKPSHEGYMNTIELPVGNNVALLEDLALYDNESWNDPRDFAKPVKVTDAAGGLGRTKEITFKTPYKDLERSELSSEGHDLLSSRVILGEDDYDRGCRKPSDLEEGFYRDTIKLGPEYVTGMDDEGEVT